MAIRKTRSDCRVGTFEKTRGLPPGSVRNPNGRDASMHFKPYDGTSEDIDPTYLYNGSKICDIVLNFEQDEDDDENKFFIAITVLQGASRTTFCALVCQVLVFIHMGMRVFNTQV